MQYSCGRFFDTMMQICLLSETGRCLRLLQYLESERTRLVFRDSSLCLLLFPLLVALASSSEDRL